MPNELRGLGDPARPRAVFRRPGELFFRAAVTFGLGTLAIAGFASVMARHAGAQQSPSSGARVHTVAMVEKGQYGIAFDPRRIHAAPGDTVRFVQRGALPHNVQIRTAPAGGERAVGVESPMLTASGSTYDLVLDERFAAGKYMFVCVPHETMGMAGLLYVEPRGAAP